MAQDHQWSIARSLKPFPGFERVYQGQSGARPIAFPGTLDSFAERGVRGYDPNLLAGLTVPLGSKVTLWIPQTIEGYTVNALYQYQVIWRMRSVKDYIAGQVEAQGSALQNYSGYHLPTSALGQPEVVTSSPSPTNDRYFLPGATNTQSTVEAEPSDGSPNAITLRGQVLQPLMDPVWDQPFTPSGAQAVWQQGVYVGSSQANNGGPSWLTYTLDAIGDELCILAYKIPPQEGSIQPWDFTTSDPGDLAFSNTYGDNNGQNLSSPYSGILVLTGTG